MPNLTPEELVERASELVHKAYCNWYLNKHKKSYWTYGNYNLLDEETKNADRATTKAVLKVVLSTIKDGEICCIRAGTKSELYVSLTPEFSKFMEKK